MMTLLEKIRKNAETNGTMVAMHSSKGVITYKDLWEKSDRLAAWINSQCGEDKGPIVVYGHKDPYMLVCFLACVKSGRGYCPVDTSMPQNRINAIIAAVNNKLILTTETFEPDEETMDITIVNKGTIEKITEDQWQNPSSCDSWVKANDIFYIIFTSGSTGNPKGVQITYDNLNNYVKWSVTLGDMPSKKEQSVFLNQAPFSFDLSVMDLYTCLASGGTLWSVDKEMQQDIPLMLKYMEEGNINYWVSTPSFADMCMADKTFDQTLLPELKCFLFCGEKLTNETAGKLQEKFPKAKVVNTYGPTESTVAVTAVEITPQMIADEEALPIGTPKPGTEIIIMKEDGSRAEDGEKGEIIICGDTVSPGYFRDSEKTDRVFASVEKDGIVSRQYKTGDEGFVRDGMVHYSGRIDLQIKMHGYRIELGDIEANLLSLDGITAAAVVPRRAKDRIRNLVAFVVVENMETTFAQGQVIRGQLKTRLPEYMVPKKITFIDSLPMTANGKTDRKKLEALV